MVDQLGIDCACVRFVHMVNNFEYLFECKQSSGLVSADMKLNNLTSCGNPRSKEQPFNIPNRKSLQQVGGQT